MPRGTFPNCCYQYPCCEPLMIHTSRGGSPTLEVSFGSVSCGVTALLLWVLACARFCLCPPRLESLFLPVSWKSCNQIPLAFKIRRDPRDRDSQSHCPIPRMGRLTQGSDFIMTVPLLPSHCGFFIAFGHAVSFIGVFQNLPVDGCSIASCNFDALAGRDERTSFYSAILNQKPREMSFNFIAAVNFHRDFGAQENKICHCFHFSPSICMK